MPAGIKCLICDRNDIHVMEMHLKSDHECDEDEIEVLKISHPSEHEWFSKAALLKKNPGTPSEKIETATKEETDKALAPVHKTIALGELFNLGKDKRAKTKSGKKIMVEVVECDEDLSDFIPTHDDGYVYDVPLLKICLMGLQLGVPTYIYGHSGLGKSTIWENVCARTRRPMIRVQHTINTEECHITGQWVARPREVNGVIVTVTEFELGPLAYAMKYGLVYLADEYDRGHPTVCSVYQAVLEGKPLVIKEADAANRIIKPHPNFRIIGTGNSNGAGDESGMYQAVVVQDAANFERWSICEKMDYMEQEEEVKIVKSQAGLATEDAKKVIDFCRKIRQQHPGEISLTPGPRVAINIGKLGIHLSSFSKAVELAFANRLPESERDAALKTAQRYFG